MMNKYIINTIEEYGRSVEIEPLGMTSIATKAFIQPLRYKNNSYTEDKHTNIGKFDNSNFLYIGKKDVRLDLYPINTVVITDEESYIVKKAQKVCVENEIVYIWAILQLYEQEESE